MTLDYEKVTLEDLEMYHYYEFECDGDHKRIKVIIKKENK